MEIERKYLVRTMPERAGLKAVHMEQRYLSVDPVLRIRQADEGYIFTYKSGMGMVRQEEEFTITEADYRKLCAKTLGRAITKTRYYKVLEDGHTAEIDVYEGELSALAVVEVEFRDEADAGAFRAPSWFGREVTQDAAYTNAMLAFGTQEELQELLEKL